MISWEGQAAARETLWPFDLALVTRRITSALQETLGGHWTGTWEEQTNSSMRRKRE